MSHKSKESWDFFIKYWLLPMPLKLILQKSSSTTQVNTILC